jgi:hypothetical protein
MVRITLVGVLAATGLATLTVQARADSATATAVSIIQPGGPRTSGGNLVNFFFNAEGSNNGTNGSFASWAPADFSGFHLGLSSLSQLGTFQLELTEANAAFSLPGNVAVYLSTDTTTNTQLGSPLTFQLGSLPQGLGTQLNNAINNGPLGTFHFPTTGNTNNGQVDTINLLPGLLSLSSSVQNTLLTALNTGADIRLVVAPMDANVAATWAGIGNFTFPNGAPMLFAGAVPEPSSLILIGLGFTVVGIVSRRKLLVTRRGPA